MKILKLKDKTYKLAELDPAIYKEFMAWAAPRFVDPVLSIRDLIAGFPPKVQEAMIREAMHHRRIPKTIDHPEVEALLKTPEGMEQMLLLMFRRHQPDITLDECYRVHLEATKELGERYLEELPRE